VFAFDAPQLVSRNFEPSLHHYKRLYRNVAPELWRLGKTVTFQERGNSEDFRIYLRKRFIYSMKVAIDSHLVTHKAEGLSTMLLG
jgi:hypothetical protein